MNDEQPGYVIGFDPISLFVDAFGVRWRPATSGSKLTAGEQVRVRHAMMNRLRVANGIYAERWVTTADRKSVRRA